MPLAEPADRGTCSDGQKSEDYCHQCFKKGAFTEPSITMNEMRLKVIRIMTTEMFGSSAEFVGKTVFHRRLRRPRCSPSLKASLASSAAAPALTLGCAPRCRLVWAMGNGASGGGSGHRV